MQLNCQHFLFCQSLSQRCATFSLMLATLIVYIQIMAAKISAIKLFKNILWRKIRFINKQWQGPEKYAYCNKYVYWCPSPSHELQYHININEITKKHNGDSSRPIAVFQIPCCCLSIEFCICFSNTSCKRSLLHANRCYQRGSGYVLPIL